jgi:hypothetical protein
VLEAVLRQRRAADVERVGDEPPGEEGEGETHEWDVEQARSDEELGRRQRRDGEQREPGELLAAVARERLLRRREALEALLREPRRRRAALARTKRPDAAAIAPPITSGTAARLLLSLKKTRTAQVGGPNAGSRFTAKMAANATRYCVTRSAPR